MSEANLNLVANSVTALCASVALIVATAEYFRSRRRAKLELAQDLINQLDSDDMLKFAVTCLDWGRGLVPVPEFWRGILHLSSVEPDPAGIKAAMQVQLSDEVVTDKKLLLYRHAFVYLFNHLEKIENLRAAKAISIDDLQPIVWVMQELDNWSYGEEPKDEIFFPAMDSWYEQGKLARLTESILTAPTLSRTKSRPGQSEK